MKIKKTLAGILSVTLLFGVIPADHAMAAKKISMSKTLSLTTGKTKTLKVKNTKKKVKWKIVSGKKYISIKKKGKQAVTVKGRKKGTAKIRATVDKKKLTCKVTVKNAQEPQKTDHDNTPVQTAAAPGGSATPNNPTGTPGVDQPGASAPPNADINPTNAPAGADEKDVKALEELIRTQQGSGISKDMSDQDNYIWKDGRLTGLNFYESDLSGELDLSPFTALTSLDCRNNQLTVLDVTKNTALTHLRCGGNQLSELDVTKNTALTVLFCWGNQLTELDVTKNTALTELDCDGNKLTALDVTKNTALTVLSCPDNQLTELDVTKNTALTELGCYGNQLTELDVTKNTALTGLGCSRNQLTELDVTKNTVLIGLYCQQNQLTELDVTVNAALRWLYCWGNQLTELDVTKNTALTELGCYGNQLTELDLTNNTELDHLEYDHDSVTLIGYNK